MTMTPLSSTVDLDPNRNVPGIRRPGFPDTLRAEWLKFWTVRSTQWSVATLFVMGAGLTVLVCAFGLFCAWSLTNSITGPIHRAVAQMLRMDSLVTAVSVRRPAKPWLTSGTTRTATVWGSTTWRRTRLGADRNATTL